MIGPLLIEHEIGRRAEILSLQRLLQHTLEILLVAKARRFLDALVEAVQDEDARGIDTAVEVDRADD